MLFGRGQARLGRTSIDLSVGLARRLNVNAIRRVHGIYDTRLLPRDTAVVETASVMVYLVLEGTFAWHPTGEVLEAPVLVTMPSECFERTTVGGGPTFRTEGVVFRSVQLCVDRAAAAPRDPVRIAGTPIALAADAYHAASLGGQPAKELESLLGNLIEALVSANELAPAADYLVDGVPAAVRRLWEPLAALLAQLDAGTTLSLLALRAGLSDRQTKRHLSSLISHLFVRYGGWRDAAARWRLRLALVLLSGPDATVGGVARAAGYGRGEAMANSFQHAGLPPPSEVRARILSGVG